MADLKPNHICKNPNCTKGADGGRKHYYACDYCDRTQSWRSIGCSFECYQEYTDIVIAERSKNKLGDVKPERTDMTGKEVEELLNKPIEEVLEDTKVELKDYLNDDDTPADIAGIVEDINKEIDEKPKKTRAKRKRPADSEIL